MGSGRVRILAAVVALAALAGGAAGATAQPVTTVMGTVASAMAKSATITTASGTMTVTFTDGTRVIRRLPASLGDVKAGTLLAVTASKAGDGTLSAVSITILDALPESRRGQWPMESGNVMTNMNVTSVVVGTAGRTIKLRYKYQIATIRVPDNTPINRVELGTVADLKAGAHVTIRGAAGADGSVAAQFISIM